MLRHRPAYNYSLRFYSTATPRKRQGRWTILSTKRLEVQAAALLEARIGVVHLDGRAVDAARSTDAGRRFGKGRRVQGQATRGTAVAQARGAVRSLEIVAENMLYLPVAGELVLTEEALS